MKKTGLFKIIMFVLLGIVVATWIFSASYFTNGSLTDLGMYNIGFFDFWQLLFASFEFSYFLQVLILLTSIGALYEVLGKTGKYRAWIENTAKKFKGKELVFLLCAAFIIAVLSSVFDYGFAMFIFFPFIISIILAMGYDKFTALLATFGAYLVGTIGSTLGYNTTGVINQLLNVSNSNAIVAKIVLLIAAIVVLFVFLAKAKRKKVIDKNTDEDLFIGEKVSNKYSLAPIIVVFALLFVILVLSCTSWNKTFGVQAFANAKETVTSAPVKLPYFHITYEGIDSGTKEVTIFGKILGTVSAFGEWYYAEMAVMCILVTLFLACHYKVKDKFEVMAAGAKKMLRPGLLVILICTVVYFAGNTMFYPTIADLLLHITNKFNLFFGTIVVALASFIHVDMLYVGNYAVAQIAATDVASETVGILTQGIYGVTMLIAPTSTMLALGLSYLGISYKEWVKKSWKLVLCLLALVLIATVVTLYAY